MVFQDGLSPFMKQRLEKIGDISPEERDKLNELADLDSLLKDFYTEEIDARKLFDRLVEFEKADKQFLLIDACEKLKKSFKWKGLPIKFNQLDSGQMSVEYNDKQEEEQGEELVIELQDATFEQMVKEHHLLVVDCWAAWCAPCKLVEPIIEELAGEYKGKITFGKLNVDSNQSVAARFGVTSIPTLLIFKGGELVGQKVGAQPKETLESELTKYL